MNTADTFNYNTVNQETKEYLKQKEVLIKDMLYGDRIALGKELKEVKEHLERRWFGRFSKWCKSIGIKHETAVRLVNYHNLIVSNIEKQELIESLPKVLLREVARPSAPNVLKEAVFNGEIKTYKEYKELRKKQPKPRVTYTIIRLNEPSPEAIENFNRLIARYIIEGKIR